MHKIRFWTVTHETATVHCPSIKQSKYSNCAVSLLNYLEKNQEMHFHHCCQTYLLYCLKLRPLSYKHRVLCSGLGIAHYNIIESIIQRFTCQQLPLEFIASITDYHILGIIHGRKLSRITFIDVVCEKTFTRLRILRSPDNQLHQIYDIVLVNPELRRQQFSSTDPAIDQCSG